MSKYDWSNVPKEVQWIAMDGDTETWGYLSEPEKGFFSHYVNNEVYMHFIGYEVFKGDWRDSLEERPK